MMIFVYLILGTVLLSICLGADFPIDNEYDGEKKNTCLMETIEIKKEK